MIKAEELRIGNKIFWKDKFMCTVAAIHNDKIHIFSDDNVSGWSFGLDYFEPIPLTPEILEKCGFEKESDLGDMIYYQENKKKGYGVCFNHEEIEFYYYRKKGATDDTLIEVIIYDQPYMQYLHQLQNLYFCLVGEELKVNLNVNVETNGR